jgi:hypothetical protein
MAKARMDHHNTAVGPTLEALRKVLRMHGIRDDFTNVNSDHIKTITGFASVLVRAIKPEHGSQPIGHITLKETLEGAIEKLKLTRVNRIP